MKKSLVVILVICLILIFLPHLINSAPFASKAQVNGESSDAYELKIRQEQQRILKQELPTSKNQRNPSAIPCPNPFMEDESQTKNTARTQDGTTTCPQ